ncbi:uncharacterized protein LOC130687369 [Daphnia carinata]|uniref:uncharacterized protein LOC130687369 n=1 Tax=Daphnia carinata TaxID=120202 RepID=UPI00257F6DCA|nr:uncharacterized protein LOC130687369 [Daphnia carinata]
MPRLSFLLTAKRWRTSSLHSRAITTYNLSASMVSVNENRKCLFRSFCQKNMLAINSRIIGTMKAHVEVTKKTTRRGAVKRVSVPEKEAPEGKRRRGETKANKHVAGLDDGEMLHEGNGHAVDIHANHVPDEPEANDGSRVTSVINGRSTRAKGALKVHFDVAETVHLPVRSTRSTRKTASPAEKKVSVQLERDPGIETVAATAKEEEEKAPAAKRSRQKKGPAVSAATMADEPPAVPATKRTRGGKKTTSEPELVKEDTSSPPPPPRRTRNI